MVNQCTDPTQCNPITTDFVTQLADYNKKGEFKETDCAFQPKPNYYDFVVNFDKEVKLDAGGKGYATFGREHFKIRLINCHDTQNLIKANLPIEC